MARDPEFPNRPDHPDFERLAALCRALDTAAEKPGFKFLEHLAKYLDPVSLTYVAGQRAIRIDLTAEPQAIAMVAWLDGFILGQEMGQRRGLVPMDGQKRPR